MVKVTVIGAAGGIGQPLAMLLKLIPSVTELALADVAPLVTGVASDLSHIDTPAKVTSVAGPDSREALKGANIVVIPAGVPRKPGMSRDDLFNINAGIVMKIAEACAESCPDAFFCIISNPVNSTVPIFAKTLERKLGAANHARIFGVTTLDIVRANRFVSEVVSCDPTTLNVPVVGGHAGTTIVPLLSQLAACNGLSDDAIAKLTDRIQNGGTEVVEAKGGAGSATLSMAHAAVVFVKLIINAVTSGDQVTACAYVHDPQYATSTGGWFSSPVTIGPKGIVSIGGVPAGISAGEQAAVDAALPQLKASVDKALEFVAKN